jgi:hypothetical protein
LKLINRRARHCLQAPRQFISEHPRPTALKRRQLRLRIADCGLRICTSSVQSEIIDALSKPPDRIAPIGRHLQPFDRIGRNERIAAERRMTHRAIEEHHVRQIGQPAKHLNRIELWIEPFH